MATPLAFRASSILSSTTPLTRRLSSVSYSRILQAQLQGRGSRQQQQQQQRSMGSWPKFRPKRIRMITMDVTGTIVSFRGSLESHYLGAAKKCGVRGVDSSKIKQAFARAYTETSTLYPCFGGDQMTAKNWWKECVLRSFRYADVHMDATTEDLVFQRIYSVFGSNAAYEIFQDARPFLDWAKRRGLVCGVLSNADERYGDSILPMLGLTHDNLQFQVFSKDVKMEKPDPRFFNAAMMLGANFLPDGKNGIQPEHVLHVGNDFRKDFEGARRAGMHSVLLDRYDEDELAGEWRRRGAPVFTDLLDVVEYLGHCHCEFG